MALVRPVPAWDTGLLWDRSTSPGGSSKDTRASGCGIRVRFSSAFGLYFAGSKTAPPKGPGMDPGHQEWPSEVTTSPGSGEVGNLWQPCASSWPVPAGWSLSAPLTSMGPPLMSPTCVPRPLDILLPQKALPLTGVLATLGAPTRGPCSPRAEGVHVRIHPCPPECRGRGPSHSLPLAALLISAGTLFLIQAPQSLLPRLPIPAAPMPPIIQGPPHPSTPRARLGLHLECACAHL